MAELKALAAGFSNLSLTKKILAGTILAGGLGAITVLWLWTQKPEFRVIYTNLSPEDAGLVVEKLKDMKVPYRFSGGGSTLLVPSEQVHDLRLQLASQGVPQGGGVGFEIFDKSVLGTTEFSQKLNLRRALQGELARTISQLEEVSNARVHLVIPEPTLFSEQQEEARAAVVVSLRPGKHLSASQIQGISHLVSGSVKGLKPEAVTIVDSQGQIRTNASGDTSAFQMSHAQLEYQKNIEQKLEKKIETILARVVGPNKTVVRVSSLLDFRQVELTEERFDPDAQVVRSEQRSQGQSNGSSQSSGASGVPGVTSNIPPGQNAANPGSTNRNTSQTTNEVINYEISKTVSRVVEPIGTIQRLSVAALIDGTYESVTDDQGKTIRNYIPRGEEEMGKLEEIVKKTMGYSPERKDQVEVVNVPFRVGPEVEEETVTLSTLDQIMKWLPLARQITGPLLILLILLFVTKPVMKSILATAPQPQPLPVGAGAENAAEASAIPGSIVPQLEQVDDENKPEQVTKEEVKRMAETNPQAVNQIVKKWTEES